MNWPRFRFASATRSTARATDEIPAHASGYDAIECVYQTMPGWRTPTQGITQIEKLPKAAREYLDFLEKESGPASAWFPPGRDASKPCSWMICGGD